MTSLSSGTSMRSRATILVFVILMGWTSGTVWGANFLVNSSADEPDTNPGNGVCETSSGPGTCSLRAAIQEANALPGADVVSISAGTWVLSIPGTNEDGAATGDLDIFDHLTISGPGMAVTTVDANGIDRVFHIHNSQSLFPQPSVTMSGITITGGNANASSLPMGGGMYAEELNDLTLEGVAVSGNTANQGAGLRLQGGEVAILRSSIHSNVIADLGILNIDGEGVYASSCSDLEIRESSVTANTGANAASGAVHLHGVAAALLANSTFAGNSANGLRIYNSNAEISQCTIVNNGNRGLSYGSFDGTHSLIVGTSILAANVAGSCSIGSGVYTHTGNIDSGDSCSFDIGSLDLVNTDPMLGTDSVCGQTVCYEPQPGSPAIDMLPIDQSHIQWQDQRNAIRPMDGDSDGQPLYDAGAVESGLIFADAFETGDDSHWS